MHPATPQLALEPVTRADLADLTAIMTRAFDDDSRRHRGLPRGGPEGYDTGEFFERWLFGCGDSTGYRIVLDGRTVGGMIVWVFPHGCNVLGTIFVDPDFQDRGVGRQAWGLVEARYPDAKSWSLETPSWATKNHHFYEACGFVRAGAADSDGQCRYRKSMLRSRPAGPAGL